MPITLQKLFSFTVPVTFPFMGEDVTVVFSPARVTGEMQELAEQLAIDNAAELEAIAELAEQKRTAEDRLAIEGQKPEPNRDVIADLVVQVREATDAIDLKSIKLTNKQKAELRDILAALLVSWDVLGDDGKPIPTDLPTLKGLPDGFLYAVFSALHGENQPDPQKAPTSSEPSKETGSAPSPIGTNSSPARVRSGSRRSSSTSVPTEPVATPPGAPGP